MPPKASPTSPVISNPRCLHFYDNGTRCRLPTRYPELPFCPRHFSLPEHQSAPVDLSPVLLAGLPDLATPVAVNTLMARIALLLSQDRISPRHAATFAYLANLLLSSIRDMQQERSELTQPPSDSYKPGKTARQRARQYRSLSNSPGEDP